jgi:3-deoxy-D-manno-octulosonic-acid transferase
MYFLIRVLQAFGLPVLLLYFFIRGLRNSGYWKSLPERLGFLPRSLRQTSPGAIWLHAVSVGEVLACHEFVRRLRTGFPRSRLFVSTSTLAGYSTAQAKLANLADGVFYAPVDWVFAVRRVLRTLRPSVVVVAETEIWPNLFRETRRTGAGLLVVNGRISDRAFPRDLRWKRVFGAVLPAADGILAQTEVMRERFLALGAAADRVHAAGNFKFDFDAKEAPAGSPVRALLERSAPAEVWIVASTMPPAEAGDVDEDDVVIAAFGLLAARHRRLLLILVPRKPERFDTAAKKLEEAGIPYLRRSQLSNQTPELPGVLLLDTMGELGGLFGFADLVFMGGTLANRGGHNILEPALFGKPVVVGPNMQNFQAIADEFHAGGACVEISKAGELAEAVGRLLENPEEARRIGRKALELALARRGATARAVEEVRRLHERAVPHYRPAMPWFAVAWLLARVWEWGGNRRRAAALRRQFRLPVPVISVGNLTMGGTGKTPCVLGLAKLLAAAGSAPGILTRGYGRISPEQRMSLAPGAQVPVSRTGDEPQIFVRSGIAPVGIGADRFETGRMLLADFPLQLLILDDGFQHLKLARDLDILLIDALNPFGGGSLFPLGRLREPVDGIARAHIVVITRSEFSDLTPAIERTVRQFNPGAPVFRGTVEPLEWVEHRSGKGFPVAARPFGPAAAFCGLGNPLGFCRTLEKLGVEPLDWVEFEDHHRYRPHEVRRVARSAEAKGAAALVTTEKDTLNLCEQCDDLIAPLSLYWLRIGLRIDGADEFARAVDRHIRNSR